MKNQSTPIINQYIGLVETDPFENSMEEIENLAQLIVGDLDLNVVKKLSRLFYPNGVSLIYVLSESHLAIHTWPELGIIHIDLVICTPRTQAEFEKALKSAVTNYTTHSVTVKAVNFDKVSDS